MKSKFLIVIFVAMSINASANEECNNFIAEINNLHKNTFPPIIVNKELPSIESLIFQYQNRADFSRRLKNYLDSLNSVTNERYFKSSSECQKLLNLSKDIEKNDKLKLEVEMEILNKLSNALEIAYQKNPKEIVKVTSCNGYGDKATKFISDFYKSTKQEDIDWIDKFIRIYEDCKLNEKNHLDAEKQNNTQASNNSNNNDQNANNIGEPVSAEISNCNNYKINMAANEECNNFIAEINNLHKNTFPPIIVNKELPSIESL